MSRHLTAFLRILILTATPACGAEFTDLRPAGQRFGGLGPADTSETESVLATGTFSGLGSYSAGGTVELQETVEGNLRLVLSDDFQVSPVPGPALVMTDRSAIGFSLTPDDIEIGALIAPSGGQSYATPESANGKARLFVYCKPFGVDVALSELSYSP